MASAPNTKPSDLPYVMSGSGPERSNPVTPVELYSFEDMSGFAPDEVFELFGEAANDTIVRFVINVATAGSIWINFLGGEAGANQPGSVELLPGDSWQIPTRAAVSAIATIDGVAYTAGIA